MVTLRNVKSEQQVIAKVKKEGGEIFRVEYSHQNDI
jgi:hypothetical protein